MKNKTLIFLATAFLFFTSLTVGTAVAIDGSPLPDCPPGHLCKP